jgi:Tfp pilus assembly protein PilF
MYPPAHADPVKTHHYSVSLDQHLLKEKYAAAKELFDAAKYDRLVPVARNIIRHFEYSNAQKNLYYWLAVSLMHQHKYEEAVEEMTECLNVYSNFQEGFLCLACSYLRLKRARLATDNYLHAINLNPKLPAPHLHLAHCYASLHDHAKAIDFARTALARFPKEGELLMVLVESAVAAGRVGEAE